MNKLSKQLTLDLFASGSKLLLVAVDRVEPSANVTAVLNRISEGKEAFYLPDIRDNDAIPPRLEGTGITVIFDAKTLHLDQDETMQLGDALGKTHPNDRIH